ncbi:OmpA family protein [Hymenobacter wooponensis]|uniref:OmpA family protein n=1 Tax=Hymenobacter wooponensis TaxID=1525360 RepID=A0A4Z0MJJ2_9BACT|nr:OmpA family protein [Hymenobacter wooponensis]TGD79355.1 OmpA family protein [Hymenobacter wooponensis]
MKVLLTLALLLCWLQLHAQELVPGRVYADSAGQYQLIYPGTWQRQSRPDGEMIFTVGKAPEQALVTLRQHPLPARPQGQSTLFAQSQQDVVRQDILQLPQARVLYMKQHYAGSYEEMRYQYTYAGESASRMRVLGRRLWLGNSEWQLEYKAATAQDARFLAEGEQLIESFSFKPPAKVTPISAPTAPQCDDKIYGIAALRVHDDLWEDDCRTIHEFTGSDLSGRPKVHRQVLPFQSYALAKGFDNCLYSVTKAPTNTPELVYRYNPSTRRGEYTTWRLPAQGPENAWISAATDERGQLYFMTSDAAQLVKVDPADGTVTVLWTTDPLRKAPYYTTISFKGAGSHGNFCLGDARTLYQVYSTDGSLMSINLDTRQPSPTLTTLTGLPERGGYSDLLFHADEDGRERLYLAGPKSLYRVELPTGKAEVVRRGIYTDLAGCNTFRSEPVKPPVARAVPPVVPATGTWRGRLLDAATLQPLPQATLRLGLAGAETTVPLKADGGFSFLVEPGKTTVAHVQLAGYLPLDSTYTALRGPYVQDVLLKPLHVGTTLQLERVRFEQGSARLLTSSYPALRNLLKLLTDTPSLTIELRGHTDNVGSAEKNVQLSEQRVATVKNYLVRHGIAAARITGLGLGGTEPRASNDREATRQLNRRVEFRVTGR